MLPKWIHGQGVAQDFDPALFVGPSQVDQQAGGRLLLIHCEVFWKRSARGLAMMSARQMLAVSVGETTGGLV